MSVTLKLPRKKPRPTLQRWDWDQILPVLVAWTRTNLYDDNTAYDI